MNMPDHLEGQIANLAFLESLYQQYQSHPLEIDPSWSSLFQKLGEDKLSLPFATPPGADAERIAHLAEAYRSYGHILANINPLAVEALKEPSQLKLENLGFTPSENEVLFPTLGLLPQEQAPLSQIVAQLKSLYSRTIGFEFKGITDPVVEEWIQNKIEKGEFYKTFSNEEKLIILEILTKAEVLESFLHTKHVGKKRFSLEGAESLIPLLAFLISQGAQEEVAEIYIGMSHRGRLNVLSNILDKPISAVLKDFDEDYIPGPTEGMGDIRYHKGHINDSVKTLSGKTIKLSMAPNPSHLESVDPVIAGQTHAKQFLVNDETERKRIMPLLMHGDAALAGQGIVYETLQMSKLPGFQTGGTVNIVINNQIGFTTSPDEGRSTHYCTDIAHSFSVPVFHVNAEDPEACVLTALLSLEIRQKFHIDAFIDLNCYRKYGHNEGDEPAFTQPVEYQIIRKKKSIRTLYAEKLIQEGILDEKAADEKVEKYRQQMQKAYDKSLEKVAASPIDQKQVEEPNFFQIIETRVDAETLKIVAELFSQIPPDFHVHPKLGNLIKERNNAIHENKPFDWGMAEFLAYATLVWENVPVRLVGQDSGRGTFSHRHALWVDQIDNHDYFPLEHLRKGQARFEVLNTCLSEAAALGFEYGYSTICTEGLTIWEAQFGDFANSAQVIIDQYIASGEQKWGQSSNLVLFLPHGFEGQGPEHSSARFERFLTLAGHENMQIVNPTTPAQLFHLLRRQVKQPWRKPLIVLTPKGLLRHPRCISYIDDLTQGQFATILDDSQKPEKQPPKVILCTGRIYYDLIAEREKENRQDLPIIRIEQLYPLDVEKLKSVLKKYGSFHDCLWVQEEPENMGAWPFISYYLPKILPIEVTLTYIGRERSATPATGFYSQHKQELENILQQVFQYEK